MKKIKKLFAVLFIALFCIPIGTMSVNNAILTKAQAPDIELNSQSSATPWALINNMSIRLYSDGNYVYAEAKNDFTFPLAEVYTQVRLYSSSTYTENVSQMTLEVQNSIADLNTGSTLIAKKAINGRQLYWRAEMIYRADSGTENNKQTDTWHIASDGSIIY